jgi:hypothetical protein
MCSFYYWMRRSKEWGDPRNEEIQERRRSKKGDPRNEEIQGMRRSNKGGDPRKGEIQGMRRSKEWGDPRNGAGTPFHLVHDSQSTNINMEFSLRLYIYCCFILWIVLSFLYNTGWKIFVPHRKHIKHPLRTQQANAISRFVTIVC